MRIKVHPDMLKRKNPNMSETEKIAIEEHAKKVGGAAEILLDPVKVCFPPLSRLAFGVTRSIAPRLPP